MKSILTALLLALATPAWAVGPVNPSTLTFNGVNTNADASPIQDLSGYLVRVAGPFPMSPTTPAPPYSITAYPIKKTIPSPTPTGSTALVTLGTPGAFNLTNDLGLTVDGQYYLYLTAVDLTFIESGVQPAASPFERNRVPPATPSGLQVNQ